MSCSFWLRRKKLAAQKAKAETVAEMGIAENATTTNALTDENTATEKPVKKAVRKNANSRAVE